jgi:hypothetical protein
VSGRRVSDWGSSEMTPATTGLVGGFGVSEEAAASGAAGTGRVGRLGRGVDALEEGEGMCGLWRAASSLAISSESCVIIIQSCITLPR